ncbi:hypothetical protein [Kineosporia babensis]|uniref:Uncharacterized protein n=1 Tax=Kineosporia babensis TaxID=499548 RepID=A0A9X1SXG8_9ACTN|nr:hypothetical protein [Kineosporia babensis]MCD5310228.1 hypothetical protein [Kineosporia babensis]
MDKLKNLDGQLIVPDPELIALFLVTAAFVAATSVFVAIRRRRPMPVAVGAAAFVGVAAYWVGLFYLSEFSAGLGTLLGLGVIGVACGWAVKDDLTSAEALAVGLGCTLLATLFGFIGSYLALASFLVAAASYPAVRLWWESRRSLAATSAGLGALLVASVVGFGMLRS